MKTKAEITVLGLQSKKHQGLIAGSHLEVGERAWSGFSQSLQRDPPYQCLDSGHLSSLQNYQRIYFHCYKPPMLWKLQQPWGTNNTQGRCMFTILLEWARSSLKELEETSANQAGVLNVLLSRATAHPTELLWKLKGQYRQSA